MLRLPHLVRKKERGELELRKVLSPFTAGQRGRLVLVSALSIVGGFADALILLIIARVAFGLAGSDDTVSISLPIVGQQTISLDALLASAAALVILRTILQWVTSRISARITADMVFTERRALVRLLLNASWALQS